MTSCDGRRAGVKVHGVNSPDTRRVSVEYFSYLVRPQTPMLSGGRYGNDSFAVVFLVSSVNLARTGCLHNEACPPSTLTSDGAYPRGISDPLPIMPSRGCDTSGLPGIT